MATCQSLLLLKVASFSTFYEVALPGFMAVTEVMSQEGEREWGALIQWGLAAEEQFKLRMLMGSFLLQTYSFQARHLYQKKNTAESMFDLCAVLILTRCSCLAFCLQSSAPAKPPCEPRGLPGCRTYWQGVGIKVIWLQLSERRAVSRREQLKDFRSFLCKCRQFTPLLCTSVKQG